MGLDNGTETNLLPGEHLSVLFIVFTNIYHCLPVVLVDGDAPSTG